jgi:hypothetical protein
MEELERRREQEKETRIKQERERVDRERKLKEKIQAKSLAQHYLQDLTPNVFQNLTDKGYFYDPVLREVETMFVPWLVDQMDTQVSNLVKARSLVDCIRSLYFT